VVVCLVETEEEPFFAAAAAAALDGKSWWRRFHLRAIYAFVSRTTRTTCLTKKQEPLQAEMTCSFNSPGSRRAACAEKEKKPQLALLN
jgi:hypothetical protein